jgi:hypothetical protein
MFSVFIFKNGRMFIPRFDGTFSTLRLAIRCEGRLCHDEDAVGIVDEYGKCHYAIFKEGADGE